MTVTERDEWERALRAIHRLWGRPVHLETVAENEAVRLSFDSQSEGWERV